jgi:hypothetical protein
MPATCFQGFNVQTMYELELSIHLMNIFLNSLL